MMLVISWMLCTGVLGTSTCCVWMCLACTMVVFCCLCACCIFKSCSGGVLLYDVLLFFGLCTTTQQILLSIHGVPTILSLVLSLSALSFLFLLHTSVTVQCLPLVLPLFTLRLHPLSLYSYSSFFYSQVRHV